MRASVRRIDLTTDPAGVELWPSLDWLANECTPTVASSSAARLAHPSGPAGRPGLWAAMAQAVERVREVSLAGPDDGLDRPTTDAQVIEFAPDAPHLTYLARVACSWDDGDEPTALPGAEVIAFVDLQAREAR